MSYTADSRQQLQEDLSDIKKAATALYLALIQLDTLMETCHAESYPADTAERVRAAIQKWERV